MNMGQIRETLTRRRFLALTGSAAGVAALVSLLEGRLQLPNGSSAAAANSSNDGSVPPATRRASRVIYLHQSGAPSQMDLFDYKPMLAKWHGKELPASVRNNQRLTELTANQKSLPVTNSKFRFAQYGQSGAWLSELLPHHRKVVDDVCFIRSVHTEAINHVQASSFLHSGSEQPGRPSLGSWLSYGLGRINEDLPAYVVLTSRGSALRGGESLQSRLWSSGFLPSQHQGVKFRSKGDPVLYLSNPSGDRKPTSPGMAGTLSQLNRSTHTRYADPEILARIEQFELAYRMQHALPDVVDLSDEPDSTFELYGSDARRKGTFASNCLLARRLAERGVRFIQLFHRGWDQHSSINFDLPKQALDVDQASAALVQDLKQRGMLEDTLVIWGGEFGRTVFCQGELSRNDYGRDHHPRCFTMWMAGGGTKPGMTYGATDDYSYNVAENPVHVHDLNATILHCLGIDHRKLTYRWKGRDFRLTDVGGNVVQDILS